MSAWLVLSRVLEAVWATALGASEGLSLAGIVACAVGLHAADRPPREKDR